MNKEYIKNSVSFYLKNNIAKELKVNNGSISTTVPIANCILYHFERFVYTCRYFLNRQSVLAYLKEVIENRIF